MPHVERLRKIAWIPLCSRTAILLAAWAFVACAPKFNRALVTQNSSANDPLHEFTLIPDSVSPQSSGDRVPASTSTHFSVSHVQFGQPVSAQPATSAHFSLRAKGISP